ncbi:hypothetical protein [Salinigranum halophilum]|jgi:hypothetical protein|uniref:hypothetical protein n=1 Tax=Salinigranum halophilum TaxID=2565931 RepID=UPI00191BFF6F|nr:hypothetical protein [Salinigranum halophilum]
MSERGEPSGKAEPSDGEGVPQAVRESVGEDVIAEVEANVPDWDDPFFDRVSDRLMFSYDLEKDERVRGETWDLFGRMRIESQKQFLHRSINFANHHVDEYLFARRVARVRAGDLDRLVDLADDLADEWITRDEEHQGTEFTFVLVAPDIPDDVRRAVESWSERTLLKFGYYGHYEVNLVVVAPEREDVVASPNADVWRAFALWRAPGAERSSGGLLARLVRAFRR